MESVANEAPCLQRSGTSLSQANFGKILYMFFKTVKYQQHPVTQLYGAEFPRHHKQMLFDCIDIVESECKHYITFMQSYGSDVQLLKKALSTITTRKVARLILDCTDTIRAKKHWNSHGATVGSTICELSSIISSLREASTTEPPPNFIELIPCGVVHTGHKYGNSDSFYRIHGKFL